MKRDEFSHVITCAECGEEYEVEVTIYAPDHSIGEGASVEWRESTDCPECGAVLSQSESESELESALDFGIRTDGGR
jgi:hypothetical protein